MTPPAKKKPAARKKSGSARRSPGRKGAKRPRKGPVAVRFEEAWFRISTRIRALAYWLGEKGKATRHGSRSGRGRRKPAPAQTRKRGASTARKRKASKGLADRFGVKERVVAVVVALVALLIALFLFVPLPLVPCSISPAKQCPPPDEAIELVPDDALLYAHLVRDPATAQFVSARELGGRIPDFSAVSEAILGGFAEDPASQIQLGRDVVPSAEREVALVALPPSGNPSGELSSETLFIAGIDSEDPSSTRAFPDLLQTVSGGPPLEGRQVAGTEISVYRGGLALARIGDFEVFGSTAAVERAVAVGKGEGESLSAEVEARGDLPDQRFADIYVSGSGAKALFGSEGGSLGQLDALIDYPVTEGFAIGISAEGDTVAVDIVSDLSQARLESNPNSLTTVPESPPDLAGLAPSDSLAYFGVGQVGPTLRGVLDTALGGDLASSFDDLGSELARGTGPDPLRELLPALRGPAALILEPTEGPPEATLLVDRVDEKRASAALARLQQPMAEALAADKRGVARFEKVNRDGFAVYSLEGPSRLGIAYAVVEGRLIVSSTREGVTRIIEGEESLEETAAWRRAIAELPPAQSALLFLDLQELSRLAELAGLAEDPLYAALSDDISNIDSLGVSIESEPTRLRSRIVLDIR